jgi:anaerobic ribonucleoside-triphosphate reductase activating protein
MPHYLRIHHYEPLSLVNGPGKRFAVWVQGCSLKCPGCFNPETHPTHSGKNISVDDLATLILHNTTQVEGVTLTGGEPLQQFEQVVELFRLIRKESQLSIILFSGYSLSEISRLPHHTELISHLDVIIAGRYRKDSLSLESKNLYRHKKLLFLNPRYNLSDFINIPPAEVIISPNGALSSSGLDPLRI